MAIYDRLQGHGDPGDEFLSCHGFASEISPNVLPNPLELRATRNLFSNVRWSSDHALADTLANVPATCRVTMLAERSDVDDGAAWRRWRIRRLAAKITSRR